MKYTDFVNSIQGLVKVEATDKGITAIEFVSAAESGNTANAKQGGIGRKTAAQESVLSNDFHSQKNAITEAACSLLQAWDALQQVKYGETASYLDIAKAIGNPKAVRAVGMANGRNPIAIVVPCHRIIGSNKTLTGYAGGLPRKQYLLNLEGAQGVLGL